jgi:hypothetical protein
MRKINPSDVCSDFETEIDALIVFFTSSTQRLSTDKDKSVLAELVFHRGYVAVEAFLSAWFLGAINRDSTQYFTSRKAAITASVEDKYSTWDTTHLDYHPPAHVNVTDLEALLDPDGWNITFRSVAAMIQRANDWLVPQFRGKVRGISTDRAAILDAAKAIRNCIAHQSQGSFDEMKQKLTAIPARGVGTALRRPANAVANVGAYLKAEGHGDKSRVENYLDEFKGLANDLR